MSDGVVGAFYDDFSTGLIDDADVTIRTWRYRTWDYNGNIKEPVLGLQYEMVDDAGVVTVDVGSAGDLKAFQPSPDGKKAVPMGNTKKLNQNTNAVLTLVSLMQADLRGELAAKLRTTDDISVLDGVKVHIIRKPQPKRNIPVIQSPDMPTGTAATPKKKEDKYIHIEKLIAYPWENGQVAAPVAQTVAAPVASPAATQAAAPAAAAPSGDNDAIATQILFTLLGENGNAMPRAQLAGKYFVNATASALPLAQKNIILGRLVSDAFLDSVAAMGINFDKSTGIIKIG